MDAVLGRVAYEAYCAASDHKSLVSGAQLPGWPDLTADIRQAWNDAADAVTEAGRRD
jgi:hypothetical protein